jgi:hypothetical protein
MYIHVWPGACLCYSLTLIFITAAAEEVMRLVTVRVKEGEDEEEEPPPLLLILLLLAVMVIAGRTSAAKMFSSSAKKMYPETKITKAPKLIAYIQR